jgi:hypothetical protein
MDCLTSDGMKSLKNMCDTLDIRWLYKDMSVLHNDNSLIGRYDSLTMPIRYSSVKHPKKMLKLKHYLGHKNWF